MSLSFPCVQTPLLTTGLAYYLTQCMTVQHFDGTGACWLTKNVLDRTHCSSEIHYTNVWQISYLWGIFSRILLVIQTLDIVSPPPSPPLLHHLPWIATSETATFTILYIILFSSPTCPLHQYPLISPTEWMVQMCPDVWPVIVTLLWNTFWSNVETAEIRQRYFDAENLQ